MSILSTVDIHCGEFIQFKAKWPQKLINQRFVTQMNKSYKHNFI